jgi:hypothetical protein
MIMVFLFLVGNALLFASLVTNGIHSAYVIKNIGGIEMNRGAAGFLKKTPYWGIVLAAIYETQVHYIFYFGLYVIFGIYVAFIPWLAAGIIIGLTFQDWWSVYTKKKIMNKAFILCQNRLFDAIDNDDYSNISYSLKQLSSLAKQKGYIADDDGFYAEPVDENVSKMAKFFKGIGENECPK